MTTKNLLCLSLLAFICSSTLAQNMIKTMPYPLTRKADTVNTYFGTAVQDPYRWLEDDRAADTKAWVQAENKVTFNYLDQIPFRNAIRERVQTLYNYERFTIPSKHGDWIYFTKNTGLQSQNVMYRQKPGGEPEIFIDPNKFSKDGTTSLQDIDFSKDGSMAAYQISEGGSDWRKVIILNTANISQVGDTLLDVKFSNIAWKGNEGFYYSSYDKAKEGSQLSGINQHHKVYFHKVGTPQSTDKLIFGGEKTPRRVIMADLTEDEHFLVISAGNGGNENELYIQDLTQPGGSMINIVNNFDNRHRIIANDGNKLYIYTNLYAPNFRVVTVDFTNPKPTSWKDLIPQTKNALEVSTAGGKIFAHYLKDATSLIQQYNMSGKLEHDITLPALGTAVGFDAKKEEKEIYYTFTNYVYPATIFKYDITGGTSTVYKKPNVQFDPTQYESKQVFYKSKDGTGIPMIITCKKGTVMNGKNPTMLYAYGGFNVNITPGFSPGNIILLEHGGIYAVPNLRGGGEYGENWHRAGIKLKKQNVFDDFVAAAEYLIKNKYTSKDYLAISGGSNGGLLIGATMTQRPDLCKVAFPAVGVMDMLRYNKFTIGAAWAADYGTAEDNAEMFNYLYHYSPYHNIKPANYPATMVTTADHDDRVVPAHSFKFASRLQEMQKGPAPVLIRIETNAGHGAGQSTQQVINQQADKWAFMFENMGVK